jgi:hypothetical protein
MAISNSLTPHGPSIASMIYRCACETKAQAPSSVNRIGYGYPSPTGIKEFLLDRPHDSDGDTEQKGTDRLFPPNRLLRCKKNDTRCECKNHRFKCFVRPWCKQHVGKVYSRRICESLRYDFKGLMLPGLFNALYN